MCLLIFFLKLIGFFVVNNSFSTKHALGVYISWMFTYVVSLFLKIIFIYYCRHYQGLIFFRLGDITIFLDAFVLILFTRLINIVTAKFAFWHTIMGFQFSDFIKFVKESKLSLFILEVKRLAWSFINLLVPRIVANNIIKYIRFYWSMIYGSAGRLSINLIY